MKNLPFVEGNRRAGFVPAVAFLALNGYKFQATKVDATLQTFALAAGEFSEAEYARWPRKNSRRAHK